MIELLKLPLSVLIRPGETFRLIQRYRNRFNYLPLFVLLIAALGVRVVFIYTVHFPLADIQPRDANLFLEMVKIFVPLFTWAVSCFAITSIMGGEAEFKEILMASGYALMPYIVLTIPIAGISRVLSSNEAAAFTFLRRVVWVWVLLLFFVSVKSMHHYPVWTAIAVCLLSVVGMGLIWSLFVLIFALTGNLNAFVQGLVKEIYMTFRYG